VQRLTKTLTPQAYKKPPVAGLVTMGRLQPSKVEDRDRDPEGTRTCHRLVHWLKAISREIPSATMLPKVSEFRIKSKFGPMHETVLIWYY